MILTKEMLETVKPFACDPGYDSDTLIFKKSSKALQELLNIDDLELSFRLGRGHHTFDSWEIHFAFASIIVKAGDDMVFRPNMYQYTDERTPGLDQYIILGKKCEIVLKHKKTITNWIGGLYGEAKVFVEHKEFNRMARYSYDLAHDIFEEFSEGKDSVDTEKALKKAWKLTPQPQFLTSIFGKRDKYNQVRRNVQTFYEVFQKIENNPDTMKPFDPKNFGI